MKSWFGFLFSPFCYCLGPTHPSPSTIVRIDGQSCRAFHTSPLTCSFQGFFLIPSCSIPLLRKEVHSRIDKNVAFFMTTFPKSLLYPSSRLTPSLSILILTLNFCSLMITCSSQILYLYSYPYFYSTQMTAKHLPPTNSPKLTKQQTLGTNHTHPITRCN